MESQTGDMETTAAPNDMSHCPDEGTDNDECSEKEDDENDDNDSGDNDSGDNCKSDDDTESDDDPPPHGDFTSLLEQSLASNRLFLRRAQQQFNLSKSLIVSYKKHVHGLQQECNRLKLRISNIGAAHKSIAHALNQSDTKKHDA
jgi:hypothetical protein